MFARFSIGSQHWPAGICLHDVIRLVSFDLLNEFNRAKAFLDSNYVSSKIAGSRCQNDFVKSRFVVGSSDNFFPLPGLDLIHDIWILSQFLQQACVYGLNERNQLSVAYMDGLKASGLK